MRPSGPQEVRLDGRKLRVLRCARGWTQVELEKRSGIGQSHISLFEAGKRTNTELATVSKLARALEVRAVDLLVGKYGLEELPDFATYVSHKFAENPKLQQALLAAYELFRPAQHNASEESRVPKVSGARRQYSPVA